MKLSSAVACAADVKGDGRDDLLILAADGRLFVADNDPPRSDRP